MMGTQINRFQVWTLLIFILAVGIRIYAPLADLPDDISISGSIYTDEGNQCHNSRSKVLYGEWYEDDWQITRYNPVLPYYKYLIFKLFGVGFLQVRSVTILFSILILLFFYLIFKSYFSKGFALLGSAFVGFNFFIVMYGKIGTFEIPMVFWMVLSLYFIEKFRKSEKGIFLFWAGASAFMAFVFKNISAYFVPVPVAAYILWGFFNQSNPLLLLKKHLKYIIIATIGILSVFILWYTLFYMPNREWIMSAPGKYIGNQVVPKSIPQAIGNFFAFNWKEQFFKIPVIWLMGVLYIPIFYRKLIARKSDITEIAFALFFLSHTLFFMFMNHRPTRYLLPAIFALLFMTVQFFHFMLERRKDRYPNQISPAWRGLIVLLDTFWIIIALFFCISPLIFTYLSIFKIERISGILIILSLILSLLLNYPLRKKWDQLHETGLFKRTGWIKGTVTVLILLSFAFNFFYLGKWNAEKTYRVRDINLDLKAKLKEDAFIAGLTAPVSVLESRHRSLFLYPDFVNWITDRSEQDTFVRYPISHALLASFNDEISKYYKAWPHVMSRAKLLKNYSVKEEYLHLYDFTHPYIDNVSRTDKHHFKLTVMNPGTKQAEIYINQIFLMKDPKQGPILRKDIRIEMGQRSYHLPKGDLKNHSKMIIDLTLNDEQLANAQLLIFNLERHKGQFPIIRYEAEKSPGRTGRQLKLKGSSENYVKYFDGKRDPKGFLVHGHNPPFEYTEGIVIAEYKLRFDGIRNPISPVCTLDLYNKSDEKAFAERSIIPRRDFTKEKEFMQYMVATHISDTKKIEFRLKTVDNKSRNRQTDIYLDFIDVTYFQGKSAYLKEGDTESDSESTIPDTTETKPPQ